MTTPSPRKPPIETPHPLTADDVDFIPDWNTLASIYNPNVMSTPVTLSPEMEMESENAYKLARDKRVKEMNDHYLLASGKERKALATSKQNIQKKYNPF